MRITLDEIRKFARRNRSELFDVRDCWNCLICQLMKEKGLENPTYLNPGMYTHNNGVVTTPKSYDLGRRNSRKYNRDWTGQQLERYVRRLQNGENAVVAYEKMRAK